MAKERPRALLCDAQQLFASGLKRLLEPELEVVAVLSDGDELRPRVTAEQPDLVVCDVAGPPQEGLDAIRGLAAESPSTRVVVLSIHDDASHVIGAFRAGARGYLLKSAAPEELQIAVHAVLAGHHYASPAITGHLVESLNGPEERAAADKRPQPPHPSRPAPCPASSEAAPPLTRREEEVLDLVAQGLRNREIAQQLYVSEATVRSHVSHLYDKLGLDNRVALAIYALHSGLGRPDDQDRR